MNTHQPLSKIAVLLVAITLLGGACLPGPTTSSIVDKFPKQKLTLNVWLPDNEIAAYTTAEANYRGTHPNVSFLYRVFDANDYDQEVINGLASGKGPDIVMLKNDRIPKFQDKLVPMPDSFFGGSDPIATLTAIYPAAVATDAIQDNKIYAIPLVSNSLVLYWNRGFFSNIFSEFITQQGAVPNGLDEFFFRPPTDWEDVTNITKVVTKRTGDQIDRAAIALGETKNVPQMSDILAAVMLQEGTEMVTVNHQGAAYHLPAPDDRTVFHGEDAVNFLKGFADPTSDYYTWNTSQPDAVQAFIDGKVGMIIHDGSLSPLLKQRNPGLNFVMAPFPQLPNAKTIVDYGIYHLHGVTTGSQFPEVAWDFLKVMTSSAENIGYRQGVGLAPAIITLPGTTTVVERINRGDPLSLQLPTLESWFKGKDPALADKILGDALDRVTLQGQNAKESLTQAAADFTKSLQKGS